MNPSRVACSLCTVYLPHDIDDILMRLGAIVDVSSICTKLLGVSLTHPAQAWALEIPAR